MICWNLVSGLLDIEMKWWAWVGTSLMISVSLWGKRESSSVLRRYQDYWLQPRDALIYKLDLETKSSNLGFRLDSLRDGSCWDSQWIEERGAPAFSSISGLDCDFMNALVWILPLFNNKHKKEGTREFSKSWMVALLKPDWAMGLLIQKHSFSRIMSHA